ncbi:hypothetical protein FBUS_07684 [Fasciolopsis buskii]|uniref:Uncharacterized protein n=1 Tax=Fasciolopsis buskii TaxID=27845 RepID=A0A8E0RP44_9TREM|nr:hypothetical protein FBUS_07684 [Fasciolopsis buski]
MNLLNGHELLQYKKFSLRRVCLRLFLPQEGSIHLDCNPVGEWNLRTDAVYLPPYPRDHPFVLANHRIVADTVSASSDEDLPVASRERVDNVSISFL